MFQTAYWRNYTNISEKMEQLQKQCQEVFQKRKFFAMSIFKAQGTLDSKTLIDKTDPFISINCQGYWTQTLKMLAPLGLNIEESVYCLGLYWLLLSKF